MYLGNTIPEGRVLVLFTFMPNTWLVGSHYLTHGLQAWIQAWIHEGESDNYFLKKTAQGINNRKYARCFRHNKNRCKHLLTPQYQFAYTYILGRDSTVRFWNYWPKWASWICDSHYQYMYHKRGCYGAMAPWIWWIGSFTSIEYKPIELIQLSKPNLIGKRGWGFSKGKDSLIYTAEFFKKKIK